MLPLQPGALWALRRVCGWERRSQIPSPATFSRAFAQFAASQDEFDRWFKQRVQETTGADLSAPPPGPVSEILADFAA